MALEYVIEDVDEYPLDIDICAGDIIVNNERQPHLLDLDAGRYTIATTLPRTMELLRVARLCVDAGVALERSRRAMTPVFGLVG